MQIVIEIPKEAYELLQADGVDWLDAEHILDAVANGTPLSEHHGKWIYDGDQIICNKCRTAFNFISTKTACNFCPECGADMAATKEEVT